MIDILDIRVYMCKYDAGKYISFHIRNMKFMFERAGQNIFEYLKFSHLKCSVLKPQWASRQ